MERNRLCDSRGDGGEEIQPVSWLRGNVRNLQVGTTVHFYRYSITVYTMLHPLSHFVLSQVVMVGCPASGKSTISKRYFGDKRGYVIINRDTLGTPAKCIKVSSWEKRRQRSRRKRSREKSPGRALTPRVSSRPNNKGCECRDGKA